MKLVDNGLLYDTDRAEQSWEEQTEFDGSNMISLATGSQWDHETLYATGRGRYFVQWWSQWQGSRDRLTVLSKEQAADWLIRNRYELPAALAGIFEEA